MIMGEIEGFMRDEGRVKVRGWVKEVGKKMGGGKEEEREVGGEERVGVRIEEWMVVVDGDEMV